VVRDAVLSDLELTERQKQMLIEIYESFRKETAIVRAADAAELQDSQTGLHPDEAALNWPEDIGPAALAGGARRLAIATPYNGADESDESDEEFDVDEPSEVFQLGHPRGDDEPGKGGTIHQFPPPTGNR
jgi:hypothetical protein